MPATIAVPGDAVLDGHALGPADTWRVVHKAKRAVREAADGSRQEVRTVADDGLPVYVIRGEFEIAFSDLRAVAGDTVRHLLQRGGEHTLVLWRPEFRSYRGDGVRSTFTLPNRWRLAGQVQAPVPAGYAVSHFDPVVRVADPASAPLAVTYQDTATFEAGAPSDATTAWFEAGTTDAVRFKLAVPPAAGTFVDLACVPVYRVVLAQADDDQTYNRPTGEPATFRLWEA